MRALTSVVFIGFCTLLRSTAGVYLNNGRCINSKMLERYLSWLDGVDELKARKLLFPDDPQDVPRAVELMSAIIQLGTIDPTRPPFTDIGSPPDVNIIADFEAIKLLGHLLKNLLEPFINVELSLSEQVSCLSALAHMLFALYRTHRRKLMPNQLYYDVQTLIKNLVFCIAKQQKLDAAAPFHLLDVGDDPIELLFAFLRMCGGHNSAINFKQAIDRLRAARDIGGVYSRNPDLQHGHRRLKLTRSEGVDHINRAMWKGNVIAGGCNLQASWLKGREDAIYILQATQMHRESYDFSNLFSSGADMLCVFGEGRYPGISDDGDEEVLEVLLATNLPTPPPALCSYDDDVNAEELVRSEVNGDDGDGDPTFEDLLTDEFDPSRPPDNDVVGDEHGTDTEQLESATTPPRGQGIRPADYLWCEKKWVHKQSVCRIIINTNFTPKSQMRLFRVRGFTQVNKKFNIEAESTAAGDDFIVGNLFLTLIRTPNVVSLALVRSTNISDNGTSRTSIKSETLLSQKSNIKLSGEIMVLLPSSFDASETPASPPMSPSLTWVWNGAYLKTWSPIPGTELKTEQVVTVTVYGHLTECINPRIVTASQYLSEDQACEVNSRGLSWAVDDDALQAAIELLWKNFVDSKVPISSLAILNHQCSGFPHQKLDGKLVTR